MSKLDELKYELERLRWWCRSAITGLAFWLRDVLPSWSSLRSFGSSRAASLTILAPFVGNLILFNEYVVSALKVPSEIVIDLGLSSLRYDISLMRLKLVYFGLVTIGLGSIIFAVLCPSLIKKYRDIRSYIDAEQDLMTDTLSSSVVGDVLVRYHAIKENEDGFRQPTFSFPPSVRNRHHSFFERMGEEIAQEQEAEENKLSEDTQHNSEISNPNGTVDIDADKSQSDSKDDDHHDELVDNPFNLRMHRGHIDVDRLLRISLMGAEVTHGFYLYLVEKCRKHPLDIMSLSYLGKDYSLAPARALVALLFTVGLGLMAIPAALIFISVLLKSLGS